MNPVSQVSVSADLLTFSAIRQRMHRHYLRQMEIPTQHAISLPWPTLRWSRPAFAFFASPALRTPHEPMLQDAPDRWWILDAKNGQLLAYSLSIITPISSGTEWKSVEVPAPADSVAAVKQMLSDIEQMSDELAQAFFRTKPGDAALQESLVKVLRQLFPPEILDQCRAIARDYCQWLSL